jgi:regulator of replication initiation timing
MQRLLDLAQTAEQQRQLREMVERLLRENEGLREDINHLRSMVAHLTSDRAETGTCAPQPGGLCNRGQRPGAAAIQRGETPE